MFQETGLGEHDAAGTCSSEASAFDDESLGNSTWAAIISEQGVAKALCFFLEPQESWSLIGTCYQTYEWGNVATFNTPAQREAGCNFIESDPGYAAQYRLWGYNHS